MSTVSTPLPATLNHEVDWARGIPFESYLAHEVHRHFELWEGVWNRARSPEDQLRRLARIGGAWRLLVLAEDWCGDASNLVPVLARFAADAPELELRILKRDDNPDLMDLYLTGDSRSIPLAIVLDPDGRPVARWGPRPEELQEDVLRRRREGGLAKHEIYRLTRRWYARDRGVTTIRELVDRIEEASKR